MIGPHSERRWHPAGIWFKANWVAIAAAAALAALSSLVVASSAAAQEQRPTINLQLLWTHQAQFAGYYVASELGFYEREGIDVEMAPGGPYVRPMLDLSLGGAEVAIGWVTEALASRLEGRQVVNVAQIFQKPAMIMVCWRSKVRVASDVKGKTIGVWNVGDQFNVAAWLKRNGMSTSDIKFYPQEPDAADFLDRDVDCATAMTYNEYITILGAGVAPHDLFVVRFSDDDTALLEDGLYVRAEWLESEENRDLLARFLRATAAGWRYASENRDEAIDITKLYAPLADTTRQRRMLDAILRLMEFDQNFGLLKLNHFYRSIEQIGLRIDDSEAVADAADFAWTHRIWYAANPESATSSLLTEAVRHRLIHIVDSRWFYILTLAGVVTFALSGFMQAQQLRYDLWGAVVLTSLPALGGGTLRDLLIGGDRRPLFVFSDPTYIYIVLAIVVLGVFVSRILPATAVESRAYKDTKTWFDTVGLATLTVLGAKVALVSGLTWYWVPACAAISCSGGGILLSMVTARKPRTFQGDPYEEIAIGGGLFMLAGLLIANQFEHSSWIVVAVTFLTFTIVVTIRMIVIRYGLRTIRLGSG